MSLFLQKEIIKSLDIFLKNAWFKLKWNTWYYRCDKIIQLINLQKSVYWDTFFINLWIYFSDVNKTNLNPKITDCHIWFLRLSRLVNDNDRGELEDNLNFEDLKETKEEKLAWIINSLEKYAISFFRNYDTIEKIKINTLNYIEDSNKWISTKYLINKDWLDYLDIKY